MRLAATSHTAVLDEQISLLDLLPDSPQFFKPAQDFIDDVLYITLPYLREDGSYGGVVFTSRGETFPLELNTLKQRGLTLPNTLILPTKTGLRILAPTVIGRWSKESARQFFMGYGINPSLLFNKLHQFIEQFIGFDDSRWYTYTAILVMLSYLKPIFETLPIVGVNGPKSSGKTQLLELLGALTFNGCFSSSITAASMPRLVERNQVTLLVDEAEELSQWNIRNEAFKIMRACYKRSGQRTICSSRQGGVHQYSVFALSVMVNIAGFDEALMSRMVPIQMTPHEKPLFQQHREEATLAEIRDELYYFAMQCASEAAAIYQTENPASELSGREREVWIAPLTIARFLDSYNEKLKAYETLIGLAVETAETKHHLAVANDMGMAVLAGTWDYISRQHFGIEEELAVVAEELRDFLQSEERLSLKTEQIGRILRQYHVFKRSPQRKWLAKDGQRIQRVCYFFDRKKVEEQINRYFGESL